MMPTLVKEQAPVPPPSYQRAQARLSRALHIDALTLVRTLHLLALCRLAVRLAHRRCPPPLRGTVRVERRAPLVRRACCSSVSCVPCGAYPIRTCLTGSRVGLLWPWPVACLETNKASFPFLAPPNKANVATLPERLCMSHCLSWSCCKLSEDDSSELVISSLIVLPSWPGDAVIPMLPSGTLPLTILVHTSRGFRVHTLICRGSGLPLFFLLSPGFRP